MNRLFDLFRKPYVVLIAKSNVPLILGVAEQFGKCRIGALILVVSHDRDGKTIDALFERFIQVLIKGIGRCIVKHVEPQMRIGLLIQRR